MKVILHEYGAAILAVIVAGLILTLCMVGIGGTQGIKGILANKAEPTANANDTYEDTSVYKSLSERKRPVISYIGTGVAAGSVIHWQQLFAAVDADQNPIEVTVLSVNGVKEIPPEFAFEKSGIYAIEVSTADSYGISVTRIFRIPVQRIGYEREEAS